MPTPNEETYALKLVPPQGHKLTAAEELILHALKIGALKIYVHGKKTKLHRLSPHFWNSGDFSTAEDLRYLSNAYMTAIKEQLPHWKTTNVLFGPAYKGILLAGALAERFREEGKNVGIAHDRKEEKDHGEGGILVGANMDGQNVGIVDDVISGGTAKRHALALIAYGGGTACFCIIGFDRQEQGEKTTLSGAQEFTKETGVKVVSACDLNDFIRMLITFNDQATGTPPTALAERVMAYRNEYGAAI